MSLNDPYAALRLPNYRRFFVGNFASNAGLQMQTTAVGWEIYERTHEPFALGLIGLVQFLPVVLLFWLAGHTADRFSRRWIILLSQLVVGLASLGLAIISWTQADYRLIYVCLAAVGIARAFQQPAKSAILPQIVPVEHFRNAVTWSSSGFHLACVIGPALGGLLIKLTESAVGAYLFDAAAAMVFVVALLSMSVRRTDSVPGGISFDEVVAGFRFIWSQQIIFGAITLDLFAVLFGGAVTLLPIYAVDILQVGPTGLGWLRTAPAIGALLMAVLLAHRPPMSQVGWALLLSVGGFGLATVGFGLSTSYWVSLLMLFLTGALDNISVVIRHTLIQTHTPDHLRGRVSAVNSLFIGASNELGGFESGLVAKFFGPVVSVVSGGFATLGIVALTAIGLPKLRRYGKLGEHESDRHQ